MNTQLEPCIAFIKPSSRLKLVYTLNFTRYLILVGDHVQAQELFKKTQLAWDRFMLGPYKEDAQMNVDILRAGYLFVRAQLETHISTQSVAMETLLSSIAVFKKCIDANKSTSLQQQSFVLEPSSALFYLAELCLNLQKALAAAKKIIQEYPAFTNSFIRLKTSIALADIYVRSHQTEDAHDQLLSATELLQRLQQEDQCPFKLELTTILGDLALVEGDYELAQTKYEEAEVLLNNKDKTDKPSLILKKAKAMGEDWGSRCSS